MNSVSETMRSIEALFARHSHEFTSKASGELFERRRCQHYPDWFQDVLVTRYIGGESTGQLSELLEIPPQSVLAILKRHGIARRSRGGNRLLPTKS